MNPEYCNTVENNQNLNQGPRGEPFMILTEQQPIAQISNNGSIIVNETLMSLETNTTPEQPRQSFVLSDNLADITNEIEQSIILLIYDEKKISY